MLITSPLSLLTSPNLKPPSTPLLFRPSRPLKTLIFPSKTLIFPHRRGSPPRIAAVAGLLESAGSVLEASAVLAAIIVIHESDHFLAATLQGIRVSKFAIGFGPALARFSSAGVEYSLRAFPLGGFVAFPDDDPDSGIPPDDPDLLRNRPIPDRLLVVSAGVLANALFAYLIVLAQVLSVGLPVQQPLPGVLVPDGQRRRRDGRKGRQGAHRRQDHLPPRDPPAGCPTDPLLLLLRFRLLRRRETPQEAADRRQWCLEWIRERKRNDGVRRSKAAVSGDSPRRIRLPAKRTLEGVLDKFQKCVVGPCGQHPI